MPFIISIVAVCPMRSEASHRSEMVSQLLFGEAAEILESTTDFIRIKCIYDEYTGWVPKNQVTGIDEAIAHRQPESYTFKRSTTVALNGTQVHVPVGTPVFGNLTTANYNITYTEEETLLFDDSFYQEEVVKMVSLLYENVPYLWGGKSSFGIDCSGFVQQVCKVFGKHLPRDAWQQAGEGEVIGFLQEARCGDLAFFDNEEGRIVHTGILLAPDEIIHASGNVRRDPIDAYGIIHRDTGARTHKLRIIKRV